MTRRKRTATEAELNGQDPSMISASSSATFDGQQAPSLHAASSQPVELGGDRNHELPLATLSIAAEQAALQGVLSSTSAHARDITADIPLDPSEAVRLDRATDQLAPPVDGALPSFELENSLDSLAAFLDNGPVSSHHFSSFISAEQPIPFFSPESVSQPADFVHGHEAPGIHNSQMPQTSHLEESSSFSRFGSRLPSLQPEESPPVAPEQAPSPRPLSDISVEDMQLIAAKLGEFACVLPPSFKLPSRLAMSRYLAGYVNGFHEHMPCLHVQTMTIERSSIELILAMAAVGAQYCFEGEKGVELFHVSQAIAMHRIRRRDARLAAAHRHSESHAQTNDGLGSPPGILHTEHQRSRSVSGPLGLPPEPEPADSTHSGTDDLMQTAQALFLLMAMATWAKHKEILREALAIQSILATLVRDDGLKNKPLPEDPSWEEWIRAETVKRTKFIVFCFFNLHCIVYNIPSLILSSELNMTLPCSAAEFKAPTAAKWREVRRRAPPEPDFQVAFHRLFSRGVRNTTEWNSSLGNYVLIHALIQHIFFVRQITRCRSDSDGELASDDVSALEQALRNWQLGWKRNPESSLDPMDPNGPVAFNSTALLRLAYIRLNIDIGPCRALDTRDPIQIANSFRESRAIKRTPKLVRAVLHSAHALSIPIKIGIRLVAQTQTFIWSIQHSLCSLECAFLLSKWLEALSLPNPEPEVSDDERRICSLVKTMLDETEFAVQSDLPLESPVTLKQLSAGVLRVWARIFKGAQTWAIVDVIGTSLNIYADMLETG